MILSVFSCRKVIINSLFQEFVAKHTLIASFRANRLMDYFDKVQNSRIVRRSFYRLNNCIQKTLEKRNKARELKSQMSYQYLEPKWITSSVHI